MEYIAKSSWGVPNIVDKLERGASGIEIQLLNPNKEKCLDISYKIPDFFKESKIVCIHTPLNPDNNCNYDIETPMGQREFVRTLILAEKLMDKAGQKMNIVCHLNLGIYDLMNLETLDKTINFIATQALIHPNCNINIENVTRRLSGVYDNVYVAKSINLPNIGTVLDTCHAMMSEFLTGKLTDLGEFENDLYTYETLEDAFSINKDICKWIHLNNAEFENGFLGFGKGHGTAFDSKNEVDLYNLKRILELYKTLDNHPPICLEVKEDDYFNCVNFTKTKNSCEEVFKIIGE